MSKFNLENMNIFKTIDMSKYGPPDPKKAKRIIVKKSKPKAEPTSTGKIKIREIESLFPEEKSHPKSPIEGITVDHISFMI